MYTVKKDEINLEGIVIAKFFTLMKLYIYKYCITLVLLACINLTFAQTPSTKVSGTLLNAQNKPVDYASVTLLAAKDSAVVQGTLSTDAGTYVFDHVKAGRYIIKGETVGYEKNFSAPFTVNGTALTVAVMKMTASNHTLNTVSITAAKPLIEHQLDRTVVNVANSVLAAGNDAMDILARAPGVTVDKDDNISLKGKQGVTVMINDKLTYLSSAQLATLLHSTDGSSIQSIEIITNPSAKYDAAGNSGIINIKLKKNKQAGTNGTVTVGGSLGAYPGDNTSLALNHKEGNLNVFATFSHGDNPHGRDLNIKRTVTDSGKTTYFNQQTYFHNTYHYNNYRLGTDYDITPKNTIGFVVSGYFNSELDRNDDHTYISSALAAVDSTQHTLSQFNQTYNNIAVNLNDRYKIDTLGQELDIDLDYSKFNNDNNSYYNTYFYLPDGITQTHAPLYLNEETPSVIDIHTGKVDYTKPITKTIKLETGVKVSNVKTDNNLQAQVLTDGAFVNDPTKTNRFIYDEKIDAAYLNLSKTYKNTSMQLGLRGEYTQSNGDLVTTDSSVTRKYFNLFPSAFISHTFNDKNDVSLSYSRRIDRPAYDQLNPFTYYLDQYTYSVGNPFLKPQYTNNFEFNYTYNKTINASLSYSHTTDAITEIILTNVALQSTYQTTLNLQTQDSYNIDINSPYTIAKWWTGNFDVNAFYLKFKSDSLSGGNLNDGQLAYVLKTTQTFTFSGFKMEIFSHYNSALTYGIYKIRPRYSTDAGISRTFDNKKLNIKFSVNDIFNTDHNDLSANYQSDNFMINQKSQSRVARLTLTYNFGNDKIKLHEHKSGAEDESQRVKGNN